MGFINVNLPEGSSISLEYNYDDEKRIYTLSQDVEINEWTIRKDIRVGGPKTSRYKYCFDNYLEFRLVDKNGEEEVAQYYYHLRNPWLGLNDCEEIRNTCYKNFVVAAIANFLNKSSVSKFEDWSDLNAYRTLKEIEQAISSQRTNIDKIREIGNLIEKGKSVFPM